ncbi:MAG: dUTP diphosphatase [Spirochaetes bacterium]|nr:dUTP diphosphatase [Spirochaetota bacterium]
MQNIKVKKLNTNAKLPHKATEHAAGYDLFSAEDVIIRPGEYLLVSTALSLEIPHGFEAQVRPRSGLAIKHGITVFNSPGTIDSDYRGEVKVILINHSQKAFTIEKHMRIAQLVFSQVIPVDLAEVNELATTARGSGGFGSTGL